MPIVRCDHCQQNFWTKLESACCPDCRLIPHKEELDHSSLIRCPKCGDTWDPQHDDDYAVLGEGVHAVSCGECEHDFTVSTSISWNFTSPALLPKAEGADSE